MKQKEKPTPAATHCGHCGKPLAEDRHWKTQYCCPSHRVMASTGRAAIELKLVVKQREELLSALELMVAIHDEESGFSGKYGKALDDAIQAQREKIEERIMLARSAIAKAKGEAA